MPVSGRAWLTRDPSPRLRRVPPPDLVPREVGERWLKYFREELPTVAFKCSTQQQDRQLGQRRGMAGATRGKGKAGEADGASVGPGSAGGVCLGADTLLQVGWRSARGSRRCGREGGASPCGQAALRGLGAVGWCLFWQEPREGTWGRGRDNRSTVVRV